MTALDKLEANRAPFLAAAATVVGILGAPNGLGTGEADHAEVGITPGDATFYRFIVGKAERSVRSVQETGTGAWWPERQYLVTLANPDFGCSYPWTPQQMHWDYCAVKWTHNNHEWTGRVVCLFLNALADALAVHA